MAKSARKKSTPGDTGVVDIAHEVVPNNNEQVALKPHVVTTQDQIKLELAKFNIADSAIAAMKKEYGALTIQNADDKKGYEAVKKAWNNTRTTRTGLEKKGLELRNQYKVITTAISGEEDRLVDLVRPLEDDLYKKWKAVDEEKEKAKKEQEEAEQKQLMARIEEIQTLGMAFADGFYQIGGTISVDVASLRGFDDEQFGKLKGAITAKKAELDKAAADAAEKLRQENEQRQKEQDEFKRQQDELKKQQEDLKRQQDQLEQDRQEAARIKEENRTNKLVALGMVRTGSKFVYNNQWNEPFGIEADLVFAMDMARFGEYLDSAIANIEVQIASKAEHDSDVKREQEEKERREKFIASELDSAGLTFDFGSGLFAFSTQSTEVITIHFNDFAGMDDVAISVKAKELAAKIKANKKEQARIDKEKQVEEEKQEKMAMTDKVRYTLEHSMIAGAATKMVPGEFKTAKYQKRAQAFLERLTNLLNEFE